MAKRSDFKRRKNDAYQTIDLRAVSTLMPHLDGVKTFAEPCCGEGHLVLRLSMVGFECVWDSDIEGGFDAMNLYSSLIDKADVIITNPPWTRALLHPMIKHFQQLKPTWLLFDSDWAYNKAAAPYLDQCSHIVAVGRLRWIEGTNMTGKDNVSWYRFWHGHSGGPHFYGRSL